MREAVFSCHTKRYTEHGDRKVRRCSRSKARDKNVAKCPSSRESFTCLFVFWSEGTGKTTIAKVFAKAINCEHAPVAEPCNECPSCLGITQGSISDVLEIDAASNNGVDEIRDIRDKVKYAPSAVEYKVYIIDEVHMLSMGAFNALLKP